MQEFDPGALHAIFQKQKSFYASGGTRTLDARLDTLARLESVIIRETDRLLAALETDLGKPPVEAFLAEIYFVLAEIRLFRRKLRAWSKPTRVRNPYFILPARSEVRREPFGVSVIVAPWNYPFQLSFSPLVAAVAAGNTVMLKPSEAALATAEVMSEIVREVFRPEEASLLIGGPELGEALLALPFDFWFYTGSERIGRLYAKAAAEHLAPIVLELGGKCPCLLAGEVDLELAAERIVLGKFFNAGQTCIAPDFVLVPEAQRERFVEILRQTVERYYLPELKSNLARMVNDSHYERVLNLLQGEVLQVGEDDRETRLFAPRILPKARWEDPAMSEEIFGPILPVIGYDSLEEALAQLASRPSPLALYAFSKDSELLERMATEVRSGSVCFNDTIKQAANLDLPFGGVGTSGMGRYRGRAGFDTFTWTRPVMRRYWLRDPIPVCPPYAGQIEKIRRWMK